MKTIGLYLIMSICCLSVYGQKCDTVLQSDDSLQVKNVKTEKPAKKYLSKKVSTKKARENEHLRKYINMDETSKANEKMKSNSPLPEYKKSEKNKNDSYWTDLISNIIFR